MHDIKRPWRQLFDTSPDGIVIVRDSHVVVLNPAAVRLFGATTSKQIIGQPLFSLFHPHSLALIIDSFGRPPQADVVAAVEARIARVDSSFTDVEVTSAPVGRDDSTFQLVLRDVTERKRTLETLRESEERLTLAFNGAQEGLWDWNIETNAVLYSPRWKEMLGYADEEIEPHVSAWERLVHPDDRVRADRANESVALGEPTYEAEFRLRHKEGHFIHVLSRGFPVRREPGGPVLRIVGTHLDITMRKQTETALRESEERLTLAFAGAQEGVWDWNLETGAVVYSPRWIQMLGYARHEVEPHVSAWERLLHPDDKPRAERVHETVMRGAPTYEGEFRLRHKDGHYVDVLSRGFPVRRQPDGAVVRIVGTHFDLTERKRNEAERARTESLSRMVFAQEDERRRIAREMHDQFGEQLTALSHGIEALKNACGDRGDLHHQVEALEAVARQLDQDVDHLVWELRPTALDDLGLRAALANYIQSWSVRVDVAAELHTSGLQDDRLDSEVESVLYRIAQEALTNVAKHARAQKVDVILERRADQVILIVEDNGVGFESGESAAPNAGFGLVGMQERAALIGASLQIESATGSGTTIIVRMAAARPEQTEHHV